MALHKREQLGKPVNGIFEAGLLLKTERWRQMIYFSL